MQVKIYCMSCTKERLQNKQTNKQTRKTLLQKAVRYPCPRLGDRVLYPIHGLGTIKWLLRTGCSTRELISERSTFRFPTNKRDDWQHLAARVVTIMTD